MDMKRLTLAISILIMLSQPALSATLHGTVYDLSLDRVRNSVIIVNSSPMQRIVAVEGAYEMDLPAGSYLIEAYHYDERTNSTASERITVVDDGDYTLDLFLYPVFDEEQDLSESVDFIIPDLDLAAGRRNTYPLAALLLILGAAGAIAGAIMIGRRQKREDKPGMEQIQEPEDEISEDLKEVVFILQKNGKRMNQRDLRKHIPLSESKISLMVSELESLGVIKKIRKGRTNIIVLK